MGCNDFLCTFGCNRSTYVVQTTAGEQHMRGLGRKLKTALGISCALACLALAFFWPGLQRELGAQSYLLFAPTISIDICEADLVGVVHIGGKLGEDGRKGEPVFVSRGS